MFDLELERIVNEIKKRKSTSVLVQIPDGLKKHADEISRYIEEHAHCDVYIWFSSCYGQCDYPLGLEPLGIDLMIQFGHNRYHKTKEMW